MRLVLLYETQVIPLSPYSIIAAALPVWYLLQPRDYLNAYLLWAFAALTVPAPLAIPLVGLTGPTITSFMAKGPVIGAVSGAPPANWNIAWF